jgi:putative nucleotidyltransferase with HDIG domain
MPRESRSKTVPLIGGYRKLWPLPITSDVEALAAQELAPAPRRPDDGHKSAGRRLLDAFEAFEQFPAFAGARGQLIDGQAALRVGADAASAIESDLALTVAVLRRANREATGARVASVPGALDRIGPHGLREIVAATAGFDFFESPSGWGSAPQQQRVHGVAVQRAADRVARAIHYRRPDELRVAALLHDIGKLVLAHANRRYSQFPGPGTMTPEDRVRRERREMGVDHAVVGGVLARRWGLPHELAHAIERHHHDGETGLAGIVRVADMIARFEGGNPVHAAAMQAAAAGIGLDLPGLRELLCAAQPAAERRSLTPNPLTSAEHRVVSELAKGRVYKEIAAELCLSVSTVRTHLYNTYRKLGVADRAQTILLAKENGWI